MLQHAPGTCTVPCEGHRHIATATGTVFRSRPPDALRIDDEAGAVIVALGDPDTEYGMSNVTRQARVRARSAAGP